MQAHGSTHLTFDVDIAYDRSPSNVEALSTGLKQLDPRLRGALGEPIDVPFLVDPTSLRNVINMTLTTQFGDLDVLGEVAGVESFEGLWDRSIKLELFGLQVRVAALDDLIAMKRAAGRSKDLGHLAELIALKLELGEEPA